MTTPLQTGWARFKREIAGVTNNDLEARAEDGVLIRIDYKRREMHLTGRGGRKLTVVLSTPLEYESPDDFKARIVAAAKANGVAEVARQFHLNPDTVKTWTRRHAGAG